MNTENQEQFNDGNADFVSPSDNAMEKLFSAIPKKDTTPIDTPAEDDDKGEGDNGDDDGLGDDNKGDDKGDDKGKDKSAPKDTPKDDDKGGDDNQDDADSPAVILAEELGIDGIEMDESELTGDTDEVVAFVKKAIDKKSVEFKRQGIQELFAEMPALGELAQHLAEGKGVESFKAKLVKPEFQEIDLEKADEKVLVDLYTKALKLKGTDEDEIEDLVETAKDSGKLKDRAAKAQGILKSKHDETIKAIEERELAEAKQIQEEQQAFVEDAQKVIKDGKIGSIVLPKEKVKGFENFLFGKTKEGVSLRDKAWSELTNEQLFLIDYMIANNFKDLGLKEDVADKSTKRAINIKRKTDDTKVVNLKSSGSKGSGIDVKSLFPQGNS